MNKVIKTLTLVALTVAAVKAVGRVNKKKHSKIYFGQKAPTNIKKGELWQNGDKLISF